MNWEQFRAILWLRWRLSRNQFQRAGQLNAVLAVIGMVLMAVIAVALGVGGAIGGYFLAEKAPPAALMFVWDGVLFLFLVIWISAMIAELQRLESIDLTKLLHLPVTLQRVFAFNYLASHCTFSFGLLIPGIFGFSLGLALGAGFQMLLVLPLALSFVFMVTAWMYCLRGWLAGLMINKRKRRSIILWLTIVLVLGGQLPNIILNLPAVRQAMHQKGKSPGDRPKIGGLAMPLNVARAHWFLPPGWTGYGTMTLREGNPWPALGGLAASCLIGMLGLMRAYSITMKFYRGSDRPVKTAPLPAGVVTAAAPVPVGKRGPLLVARTLPVISERTSALALATLRSLLRMPEIKMAALMPVVMAVILSFTFLKRVSTGPISLGPIAATVAVGAAAMSLINLMANMFGLDRNGFRSLVLLPVRGHQVLAAKNLAFLPFMAATAFLLLVMMKIFGGMRWLDFIGGVVRIPAGFLLFCLLGNAASILAPFRLAQGSLKMGKMKPVAIISNLLALVCLPLILLPLFVPPVLDRFCSLDAWSARVPVDLIASVLLLPGVFWLYREIIRMQGRWFERREQAILQEVTVDVE